MNLQSFFKPHESSFLIENKNWETTHLGGFVKIHKKNFFPKVDKAKIAIFNIAEFEGSKNNISYDNCKIRGFLYSFHIKCNLNIVDLGYLNLQEKRKDTFKSIQQVCSYLIEKNIIPIIIGGGMI